MNRCLITDRRQLPAGVDLVEFVVTRSPELVQLREKDLDAWALAAIARDMIERGLRVVVNSRVDVALACGAAGAHLPGGSPPPGLWRHLTPAGFLIGVSCHTVEEVRRAEAEGADYAFFSPVFEPISKASYGPAVGLRKLAEACAAVRIPVWALGGITSQNAEKCIEAGAAGVAGISLFL
jgi:thiamine-phosphate pyrophosphorylase